MSVAFMEVGVGSDGAAAQTVIAGAGVRDRVLYVVGTSGHDEVLASRLFGSVVAVADFLSGLPLRSFASSSMDQILVLFGGGNDTGIVTGADNDTIHGGHRSSRVCGQDATRGASRTAKEYLDALRMFARYDQCAFQAHFVRGTLSCSSCRNCWLFVSQACPRC